MRAMQRAVTGRRGQPVLRLLAVGSLAATLAGCYYQTEAQQNAYPTDYRLRHPITLREGVQNVEILIGRNRGGLNPSQRADVLAFAQQWRHEAGSGIIIDEPRGGPTDHAAADSMREISSILGATGVPRNAIYVRHYKPSRTSLASIKLSYSKLVADAGPCGQWPRDLGPSWESGFPENQPYWNLGCASQRNLASMVDNPADLVQPRGEIPPWAPRRSVMIEKWRKGENPSGSYVGFDVGKITDIGR
jgi:pilus assembly protein CpaD